jgi:hypothetical protein
MLALSTEICPGAELAATEVVQQIWPGPAVVNDVPCKVDEEDEESRASSL